MFRNRTVAALAAAGLMGAALLAGCSSSDSSSEATETAAAGETTEMLPPVIITEDQTEATCSVGNFLDIVIPEDKLAGTTVSTSDDAVVTVTQAKQEGDALYNPGGECVAPGSATVTVTNPDASTRDIAVTVAE